MLHRCASNEDRAIDLLLHLAASVLDVTSGR